MTELHRNKHDENMEALQQVVNLLPAKNLVSKNRTDSENNDIPQPLRRSQ